MKYLKILLAIVWLVISVSCGSYKRNSSETDFNQNLVTKSKKLNDKVVTETVETTIDFFDLPRDTLNLLKAKPKKRFHQTKKTVTKDKGTLDTNVATDTSVKTKDKNKENPWQPPWYLSGLIVLVLLVAYKVFKTKFTIVKRIKNTI